MPVVTTLSNSMSLRQAHRPSVYDYTDYRGFLRDYYTAEKARRPAFSYRYFARRAGHTSPNFLKLVIEGKRNLGPESVTAFARALELDAEEAAFFADLVAFDQAKREEVKTKHLARVTAARNYRKAGRIEGQLFEYLSHWYLPAIRELVARPDFTEDPKWISRELVPHISARRAADGLKVLLNLGLVRRLPDGRLERGDPSWTTGPEVNSKIVASFHHQMLMLAAEAVQNFSSEERSVTSLVVCVRAKTMEEIRRRITTFQQELLALCDADEEPELVCQMGMQLFPLSRTREAAPVVPDA
jgi:uncharacterized protein (TIGR02147 family)